MVIAPIIPIENWQAAYSHLLDAAAQALDFPCDLTFELITHRFTPASKEVLQGWYPKSSLEMDEASRAMKRNKFGGINYLYNAPTMTEMRRFFEREIEARFPRASILYWT